MEQAIQECIEEGFNAEFLKRNGGKVMSILNQVWTEEEIREFHMQEGFEQGMERGIKEGLELNCTL